MCRTLSGLKLRQKLQEQFVDRPPSFYRNGFKLNPPPLGFGSVENSQGDFPKQEHFCAALRELVHRLTSCRHATAVQKLIGLAAKHSVKVNLQCIKKIVPFVKHLLKKTRGIDPFEYDRQGKN